MSTLYVRYRCEWVEYYVLSNSSVTQWQIHGISFQPQTWLKAFFINLRLAQIGCLISHGLPYEYYTAYRIPTPKTPYPKNTQTYLGVDRDGRDWNGTSGSCNVQSISAILYMYHSSCNNSKSKRIAVILLIKPLASFNINL